MCYNVCIPNERYLILTMEQNQTTAKKQNLKKKRILVLVGTLLVFLLLVLLNSIDFESTPVQEETYAPYVPETYSPALFADPDFESDIFKDSDYQKLDHTISYSYNGQIVSLENDLKTGDFESYDSPFDQFFVRYFTALAQGFRGSNNKTEGFNAFYSDVYYRTHKTFGEFAPQKVYDIDVRRRSDEQIIESEEKEEDAIYIGCTLTSFEVRYKIYRNDGTFRRDITGDDVIVQYIDLLRDKSGNLTINSVGYGRHKITEKDNSIITLILPLVWIVLTLVSLVLFFILKKRNLLLTTAGAFVTFLVSITGSLLWQAVTFGAVILLLLVILLLHRKKKTAPEDANENE